MRLVRTLRIALTAVVGLVGLGVVLVGLAFTALNLPQGRRLVVQRINETLAPMFRGQIRVDRLGAVGLFGVSGVDVTIVDPRGRTVLDVRGVRARVATWSAVHSALFEKASPLTVVLEQISVNAADVRLDTDDQGQLDLVDAFAPRTPSAPSDPNARGFRLVVSRMALQHANAHGQMATAPSLDVDLDDLALRFQISPTDLSADLDRVRLLVRHIANGADVSGRLEVHGQMPLGDSAKTASGRMVWEGAVGSLVHTLGASFERGKVDATLNLPEVTPDGLRSVWSASPVTETAQAHLEAHGVLPDLDVDLRAALGSAAFQAQGHLVADAAPKVTLAMEGHDIDARQWAAGAPVSRASFRSNVAASLSRQGAVDADGSMDIAKTTVAGEVVPPIALRLHVEGPDTKRLEARADIRVAEPGAPATLGLRYFPKGQASAVDFTLAADASNLDAVSQLRHAVSGAAHVAVSGTFDLAPMRLSARIRATGEKIVQGSTRVGKLRLDVDAQGPIDVLRLNAALRAKAIEAAGRHWTSADVIATGTTAAAKVSAALRGTDVPDVDATVDVAPSKAGVSLSSLRATLSRLGERASASADRVRIAGTSLEVDEARIEGLGSPISATLTRADDRLTMRASSGGVDIGRLGRLACVERTLRAGRLSFDTDVILGASNATGKVSFRLDGAEIAQVAKTSARGAFELRGRHFSGTIHAQAADTGSVDIDAPTLDVAGTAPFSATSWRNVWGVVSVEGAADLAKVGAALPATDVPWTEGRGHVTLHARIERDDARDVIPDVHFALTTDRLAFAPKTEVTRDIDGVLILRAPEWHLEGVDFSVDLDVDGDTGGVAFSSLVHDAKGELGQVHATFRSLPYDDLFHNRTERLSADFQTVPFDVRASVPERGLGGLPSALRQNYLTGKAQADVHVSGTAVNPLVDVVAALHSSHVTADANLPPTDIDVAAHYEGRKAKVSATARARGRDSMNAEVDVDAPVTALWQSGRVEWGGSAKLHFDAFPLATLPALDDKLVSGTLNGDVVVTGLHRDARAEADISVDGFRLGSVAYKNAQLHADIDGSALDATVRIDQDDGFLETKAHAATTWSANVAPALAPGRPLDVSLSSQNFRIAGLLPFVDNVLDELDGRLDADTHLELDPNANAARLSGTLTLRRGQIEAEAGGGELHDVTANLRFSPDGSVMLEKLSAAGLTGKMEATGEAKLVGTQIQGIKATVVIPSDSPIPVSGGGAEIGNVDGRVEISQIAPPGGGLGLHVNVPHLRVALPEGSSASVQGLGPAPNVHIGAHRGQTASFVLVPIDPIERKPDTTNAAKPTTIDVTLGDIQVVKGKDVDIPLTGRVAITAGATTEAKGQIRLIHGGVLSVQGKQFEIENGTVTLSGDPTNPLVVVKAGWKAPDGTIVFASFVGPLKTGKVTLSSEPPFPQQEIVEILLFGTPDGPQKQNVSTDPTESALATAGGEAAQPLNHALSQLGLGAVTAKVDTSTVNPTPEVEIQIAKDISVELAIVLGQPPPGVNPDTTRLTIDWRFLSKWSLASTVGDAGTTIFDVLWQRRY